MVHKAYSLALALLAVTAHTHMLWALWQVMKMCDSDRAPSAATTALVFLTFLAGLLTHYLLAVTASVAGAYARSDDPQPQALRYIEEESDHPAVHGSKSRRSLKPF